MIDDYMTKSDAIEFVKMRILLVKKDVAVMEFMFSYALISNPSHDKRENVYRHRFCYTKEKFSLKKVVMMAEQWDLKYLPPKGWVKYKGVGYDLHPYQLNQKKWNKINEEPI